MTFGPAIMEKLNFAKPNDRTILILLPYFVFVDTAGKQVPNRTTNAKERRKVGCLLYLVISIYVVQ